jgi:hypothetical protein
VLPQPQPDSGETYKVIIDDKEMGKLRQGQTCEWSLEPGTHRVQLGKTGVGGFVSGLFGGDNSALTTAIDIPGGETVKYEMGYKLKKCAQGRRRHTLFLQRAAHE